MCKYHNMEFFKNIIALISVCRWTWKLEYFILSWHVAECKYFLLVIGAKIWILIQYYINIIEFFYNKYSNNDDFMALIADIICWLSQSLTLSLALSKSMTHYVVDLLNHPFIHPSVSCQAPITVAAIDENDFIHSKGVQSHLIAQLFSLLLGTLVPHTRNPNVL